MWSDLEFRRYTTTDFARANVNNITLPGIYTGSVYKDYGLLKNGFPAESVVNGSVLVVKTHEWGAVARKQFQKAILLVRAPGPAIQAEFNRQSGGHVGFASPERYRRNRGRRE